ncbi:amidinotransferase, partial [Candidatus Saccharibacteria bacterium]|nr:amidinotransferase [Candidatus Saccharibacteria bacterium]
FSDEFAINAYMDSSVDIDNKIAAQEHQEILSALESAGVEIIKVRPPVDCQDGVYTANWGLVHNNKVVLSNLPNKRKNEEPYAKKILQDLGFETIECPYRFSGQGDALQCGGYLFIGTDYRTDLNAHNFVRQHLGFETISVQTIPYVDKDGNPKLNEVTGWPDSFFYDLDLAIAVLSPDLIAWCPEAFVPESQARIRNLNVEKIKVSYEEATKGFACNLVSTGSTVIMSANAPELKKKLENRGFKVVTPTITELAKGGGYIRCSTLTLG